jgi:hypothetical protein
MGSNVRSTPAAQLIADHAIGTNKVWAFTLYNGATITGRPIGYLDPDGRVFMVAGQRANASRAEDTYLATNSIAYARRV